MLPLTLFLAYVGLVSSSTLTVGVGLSTNSFAAEYRTALEMWQEHVAANGIGETGIDRVEFVFTEGVTATNGFEIYKNMTDQGIRYFLGPYGSGNNPNAAKAVEAAGGVMVTGGAAAGSVYECSAADVEATGPAECQGKKPHSRRFDSLYGTFSPGAYYMKPFVSLAKIRQAKTMAIFEETKSFTKSVCAGALQSAKENKIEVMLSGSGTFSNLDDDSKKDQTDAFKSEMEVVDEMVKQLKEKKPDVFVACVYSNTCKRFMEAMQVEDWLPDGLALSACMLNSAFENSAGENRRYVMGPSQWSPELQGDAFTEGPSHPVGMFRDTETMTAPMLFNEAFKAKAGKAPSYQAAAGMAALYLLHIGISDANTTDPMAVRKVLDRTFESSFYGTLSVGRFGSNTAKPMVTLQYDHEKKVQIVTPLTASTADAIWPMPKWFERNFVISHYTTSAERGVMGFAIASLILCFGIMGCVFMYRKEKVFRALSPSFCIASLIGCMLCLFSVFTFPLTQTAESCATRVLIFPVGIGIVTSAFFVKLWRLNSIFNSSKLMVRKLSDGMVLRVMMLLLAPTVLFSVLWATVQPHNVIMATPDPIRPFYNYMTCDTNGDGLQWAVMGYLMLLVLAMFYLVVKTRNVKDDFNEGKRLSLAFFCLIFVLVTLITVQGAFGGDPTRREAIYALTGISCVVVFDVLLLILFVPPLLMIWFPGNKVHPSGGTTQLQSTMASSRPLTQVSTTGGSNTGQIETSAQRMIRTKYQGLYNDDFQQFQKNFTDAKVLQDLHLLIRNTLGTSK